MTYESPQEKARREGRTLTGIYSKLAAGRIAGAHKVDGKWRIPVADESQHKTEPPHVVDWKSAASGERSEEE
jgi:hypothetical protein